MDEEEAITLFNPAAERMFGRTADETIGRQVECLMPAELRERYRQSLHTCFTSGVPDEIAGKASN